MTDSTEERNGAAVKETSVLRLENTVVVRKMPMTSHGCDMFRAVRNWQQEVMQKQQGKNVDIPFPTSLQLMLADYVKLRGIPVQDFTREE